MKRFFGLLLLSAAVLVVVVGGGLVISALTGPAFNGAQLTAGVVALGVGLGMLAGGVGLLRATKPPDWAKQVVRGGSAPGYPANVAVPREADGVPYTVEYKPPVKKGKAVEPPSLTVRVPAATPAAVSFDAKTGFDRFALGMGVARHIVTDDPEFDRQVQVRSGGDDYAQLVVADELKRAAVLELRLLGFPKVGLTGGHAEAVWVGFDPKKHDAPGLTDAAARCLQALANDLPPAEALAAADFANPGRGLPTALWVLLSALALTVALVLFRPPIRTSELALPALTAYAGAFPLFAVAAALVLRGTTTSHDRWRELLFGGFFLLFPACLGVLQGVNVLGDRNPPVKRVLPVVDTQVSRGKSTSYYAIVADWARPGEQVRYNVGRALHDQMVRGRSRIVTETSIGWLGVEYELTRDVQP